MKTPFFSAHSVARSTNFADSQLINLYGEVSETKNGKGIGALFAMPGLTQVAEVGAGPINGMVQFPDRFGFVYVISGTNLYTLDGSFNPVLLGALGGTAPFSMIQNGTQLAVFGNGQGTSYSGGVLAPITMPFTATGTIIASYQDGFGLIHQPDTNLIFQSAAGDLTNWPALNVAQAGGDPDYIVALIQTHRELYVIKVSETEIWTNAGSSPVAFQRLDGPYIEAGCIAPKSVAKIGESVIWLGSSTSGQGTIYQADQFRGTPISTHALETEIQTYGEQNIGDAVGWAYKYGGHDFYIINFPTPGITWAYDKTTSERLGIPFWSQWLTFNGGVFGSHLGNAFTMGFDLPLLGSRLDGKIYKYDPASLADGAFTRKWLRSWRALEIPTMEPTEFRSLTIDMETGGTGTSGSPTCSLRWSDDGGHTYSAPQTASVGTLGQTTLRVKFNRLGATRRNNGLDRIFELSSSSVFPARLIAAELE